MLDPVELFSPKPEGAFGFLRETEDRGQGDDVTLATFSQVTTLQDLARSWLLFSPGLLFTHLPLPVDPVQDYINSCPEVSRVVKFQLPLPVFRGMDKENWDRMLMACSSEYWEAGLKRHLQNLAIQDNDRQRFYRTFGSTVTVPDVLQLIQLETLPKLIPTVQIEFIGYATQNRVVTAVPASASHEPSPIRSFDPTGDDVLMALTALAGKPVQTAKPKRIPLPKPAKVGAVTPEWLKKMQQRFRGGR